VAGLIEEILFMLFSIHNAGLKISEDEANWLPGFCKLKFEHAQEKNSGYHYFFLSDMHYL